MVKNIFRNISIEYPGINNSKENTFNNVKIIIKNNLIKLDINVENGYYVITGAVETNNVSEGLLNNIHYFENNQNESDIFIYSTEPIEQTVSLHKLEFFFSPSREYAYESINRLKNPIFYLYLLSTESIESNFDEKRDLRKYEIIENFGILMKGENILYIENNINNVDYISEYDNIIIKCVLFSLNSIERIKQVNFDRIQFRGLSSNNQYFTDYVFSMKRTVLFENDFVNKRKRLTNKIIKLNMRGENA